MDRLKTLGKISDLKAQIDALKEELNKVKEEAILKGYAEWKFTKDGKLSTKAPDMNWWKAHRAQSFERLCERSADPDHPDHKAFWKKPTPRFSPVK